MASTANEIVERRRVIALRNYDAATGEPVMCTRKTGCRLHDRHRGQCLVTDAMIGRENVTVHDVPRGVLVAENVALRHEVDNMRRECARLGYERACFKRLYDEQVVPKRWGRVRAVMVRVRSTLARPFQRLRAWARARKEQV